MIHCQKLQDTLVKKSQNIIQIKDTAVMKSDYTFQITRNSGHKKWLLISNYKTLQLRRMTTHLNLKETPVMKNDW